MLGLQTDRRAIFQRAAWTEENEKETDPVSIAHVRRLAKIKKLGAFWSHGYVRVQKRPCLAQANGVMRMLFGTDFTFS